ncbi:MAG: lysine 2,3-aminomutase [Anaerolineales bacterium]|nr:lysine 2,3-aminomutase [Anaerolineales bacterium]
MTALNPFPRNRRAAAFADVPDEKWFDWRWQMSNRLNTVGELARALDLTESERQALEAKDLFRVDITPYFASLIDPHDPHDPIRQQVIPTARELAPFTSMMEDSLAEDRHSPVPGLVHRYPDRVLMLVTTQCASYCRYCTRSRIVGDPTQTFSRKDFEAQIAYLERTPQVRDVLLSGGDPLVLAPKLLDEILGRLRAIPHIEILRIGSRVPVFLPMRVTAELCETLQKYHPLWLNIHVNHPSEISGELADACDRLTRAGVPLGNQSVLLAGVNDSVHIQRQLVHSLVRMRVRPYYLYQCDLVHGAGHFRTTVAKGIEIIEGLRGHTSGYAVPHYIVDAPGGGGKIPVMPNYVISQAPGKVVFRNYEGFITTYTEPEDYNPHAVAPLEEKVLRRPEPGQAGVLGLLQGEDLFIKPAQFDEVHTRGGGMHRLKADETKWQPLGIGHAPDLIEGAAGSEPPQLTGGDAASVINGE